MIKSKDVLQHIKNTALFGKKNGLDGVVCSLWESEMIKECCGQDFLTVTPGIGSGFISAASFLSLSAAT